MKAKKIDLDSVAVDSRYRSETKRQRDSKLLGKMRHESMGKVTELDNTRAKVLQIKLSLEKQLNSATGSPNIHFPHILEKYVDSIYPKRVQFALDLDIKPVLLSQMLNGHRFPTIEFIEKLTIHSEKILNDIGGFPEDLWFKVYYQCCLEKTLHKAKTRKAQLRKSVCLSLF